MATKTVNLLRQQIRSLLDTLSPREQKILDMRFGLTDEIPHTLSEVGKAFGITPGRIRQIEARAIAKAVARVATAVRQQIKKSR